MNKDLFVDGAPGRLWEISVEGRKDWAFIPEPLPSEWQVSTELWGLLVQAREELARLDGVGRYMPNYNLLLRPLQRREALRSSSLEGTYATPQQLLLFEIEPREPKSANDPVNSWQEVWNYNRALELALSLLEKKPLSLNLIRGIHHTLLSGVRGSQRDPGNFRRSQVHIGSDRRFIPPPPNEVMPCLDTLEKYIHQEKSLEPLISCFMVHYQFETIHPFLDGNGRVGRLVLSLMIYEQCKLSRPWLYLSAFFDKYKDEYINLLFQVSTKGNWNDWIAFCLRGTIEQSKDALNRFDRLLKLRSQYMELLNHTGGNIRLSRLVDHLFESPAITVSQFSDMCGIQYNTARADIYRLVNANILVESDIVARPKIYFAPDILDIAYGA
ncbi:MULTISPECIES: Fic family protein [Leptolyngbya]|nr:MULTISPECIES: Fic/DOC family N-terminal domain-containing protein [Leptolyngbya]MBD2369542.1 Fic family protein [Leptolyngbya sp. FACHB-161]MBD2377351.1 Fic family protein [Leptolyngbya sp. FACHB-238]MBD2401760.1 Fic family protein [Leptolyngbya sp. FACHB-239]MBD2408227.1 Fic family protein [Leptolyngbya sp. FACHB-402]ULP27768.1 Fic family protein [Leptolyngbya boryana IU 594]